MHLEEYRATVFPGLQNGVNEYLERFNAGFHIDRLVPANIGGGSGSTCTYNVVINDTPIAVTRAGDKPSEPSFRNAMSAGDRNTLALALFFSSLDQNPNLSDTVSSHRRSHVQSRRAPFPYDCSRSTKASRSRTKQLIVLSHNKRFLCNVWNGVDTEESVALEIRQDGEESTIQDHGM